MERCFLRAIRIESKTGDHMKGFLVLFTVSVTMMGIAFADNTSIDLETGADIGVPYHPGSWVTTTINRDTEWFECFCMPSDTYDKFPSSSILDPSVIPNFDVLRMTHASAGASQFAGSTYIQNSTQKNWSERVLDLSFYFAAQATAESVGFYVNSSQRTDTLTNKLDFDGLAFLFERDPATQHTYINIYDTYGLAASTILPIVDPNFHLVRVRYDDLLGMVNIQTFEWFEEVTVLDWTPVSAVPGTGWLGFGALAGTSGGGSYVNGYQYIDDICVSITDDHPDITVDAEVTPTNFELKRNHPNPFNPTTTISFVMPETGMAKLTVFDITGKEVAVLHDGMAQPGETQVVFDASKLTSGVYFYSLQHAGLIQTQKMLLVK
jgi:hypothetical protein